MRRGRHAEKWYHWGGMVVVGLATESVRWKGQCHWRLTLLQCHVMDLTMD